MGNVINKDAIQTIIASDGYVLGWTTHADIDGLLPHDLMQRFNEGAGLEDNWASYDCYDNHDLFYLCIPEELKDIDSLPKLGALIDGEIYISHMDLMRMILPLGFNFLLSYHENCLYINQ